MNFSIRHAEKRDVETIAHLIVEIEQFYDAPLTDSFEVILGQVDQTLFGNPPVAFALLAQDADAHIVGFASYSFHWPAAGATHLLYLKELFVREGFRRQGIGALLMDELLRITATRQNAGYIEWATQRDNAMARSFYEKLGFTTFDKNVLYRSDARSYTREHQI